MRILARLEEILARRSPNVVIVYFCFSILACLEDILAHASCDANPDRQGLARLEKTLTQPCALELGIFLGRFFSDGFVFS